LGYHIGPTAHEYDWQPLADKIRSNASDIKLLSLDLLHNTSAFNTRVASLPSYVGQFGILHDNVMRATTWSSQILFGGP
jgi:hypothetical protein